MTKTVCVTGASGFIGAHVVQELLEHGYHVRGTVRSLKNPAQYAYLRTQIGRDYLFDNRKIKQELGLEFISIEQTILATTADIIQWGHVPNNN